MTGPRQPLVYVLLVNWRGWKDTVECLSSLFQQDYSRFRIVVCNNDPGDDSVSRIVGWAEGELEAGIEHLPGADPGSSTSPPKPIPIRVLDRDAAERGEAAEGDDPPIVIIETGENLGFAGGNNVGLRWGLRNAEVAYFWLLNNDTVADRHALRKLVELAQSRSGAGMIGSKLLEYDRPEVIQLAAGGRVVPWRGLTTYSGAGEPDSGQWDDVLEVDYVTGASLLVKRKTVEEIGLLDERYFLYSEEVDWCLRASARGWKLLYAPESRIWHKGGQSVGHGSALHDYYTVRSMLLLVQKFYPRLLPVTFAYSVYRCLAPKLVRFQMRRLRAIVRAYADFVRMWGSEAAVRNPPKPDFSGARVVDVR